MYERIHWQEPDETDLRDYQEFLETTRDQEWTDYLENLGHADEDLDLEPEPADEDIPF